MVLSKIQYVSDAAVACASRWRREAGLTHGPLGRDRPAGDQPWASTRADTLPWRRLVCSIEGVSLLQWPRRSLGA